VDFIIPDSCVHHYLGMLLAVYPASLAKANGNLSYNLLTVLLLTKFNLSFKN